MLEPADQDALRLAYGWRPTTTFRELQRGENDHALVENASGRWVVRRYRSRARSRQEIKAELAWMDALKKHLAVPEVVPNLEGGFTTEHGDGEQQDLNCYAVFCYVEGTWLEPTPESYYHLGRILRSLHEGADQVAEKQPADWPGWQRPTFNRESVIEASLANLLAAPFLTQDDKTAFARLAEGLAERWQHHLSDRRFIHADVHLGNVLKNGRHYTCLDFDECGFGPRAFDVASVRLHPISHAYLTDVWPAFSEGYGIPLSEAEIRFGTALRFFYMAGKIPLRLDLPALSHQPEERLRRYFGYIQAQLNE